MVVFGRPSDVARSSAYQFGGILGNSHGTNVRSMGMKRQIGKGNMPKNWVMNLASLGTAFGVGFFGLE